MRTKPRVLHLPGFLFPNLLEMLSEIQKYYNEHCKMQRLIRIIADDQPACTSGQGSLLLLHSYRFTLMTLSAWFLPSAFRRKKERYREAKSFPRVTEIANNRKYFESTLSTESENSFLF